MGCRAVIYYLAFLSSLRGVLSTKCLLVIFSQFIRIDEVSGNKLSRGQVVVSLNRTGKESDSRAEAESSGSNCLILIFVLAVNAWW